MKWILYKTTNKVNGKLYIGVHKTTTPYQFDGYIGNGIKVGRNLLNPKTVFQKALKKYGYASFVRETLEVFNTPEEAYERERIIVNENFISSDTNYNMNIGGLHGALNYKKVYQYSLKGQLIKVWKHGQVEMKDDLGLGSNEIYWALTQKKELRQSYWSLTPVTDFSAFSKRKEYYVYKFSLTGELLDIYENIATASKELNVNYNVLKGMIQGKYKYRGYYWTTDIEAISEVIKINKLFNTKRKYIDLVDLHGNIVKEYVSLKDAAKDLGYKYKSITTLVQKQTIIKNQYRLTYPTLTQLPTIPILQIDYATGEVVKEWSSISECKKHYPKCKDILRGARNQTHGYTFKIKRLD